MNWFWKAEPKAPINVGRATVVVHFRDKSKTTHTFVGYHFPGMYRVPTFSRTAKELAFAFINSRNPVRVTDTDRFIPRADVAEYVLATEDHFQEFRNA